MSWTAPRTDERIVRDPSECPMRRGPDCLMQWVDRCEGPAFPRGCRLLRTLTPRWRRLLVVVR